MVSKVYVIGLGMGNPDTLTCGAMRALEESELIVGSRRLLDSLAELPGRKVALVSSRSILDEIRSSAAATVSVVMSGDVGFYSGATALLPLLQDFDVQVIPGVSSLSYLCARLGLPWQDVYATSAHGKECDVAGVVQSHARSFFLTGGATSASELCAELVRRDLGEVRVHVGERLSYPDEHLSVGTAAQLSCRSFDPLSVVLVENERPRTPEVSSLSLPDGAFIRGAEARVPRILVAGTSSGCGKTTLACGLMRLLSRRGLRLQACKSGPDYLDPTFHARVLGVASRSLDLFLEGEELVRETLATGSEDVDLTVIEGAMGYYDGIAMGSDASSWDLARLTQTPVLLVVDAQGRALSTAAEVKGFLGFRDPSQIVGVILNRVSASYFPSLKRMVEREAGVPVLGYLPRIEGARLESRHLGLVDAAEVMDLQEKVDLVADALEQSLDVDAVLRLAAEAPAISYDPRTLPAPSPSFPVIAVARDEAFSFYYQDSLELLRRLGARLEFFSPLRDSHLPKGASGLYLGGGYPELHAQELSANKPLLAEVAEAVSRGMPTIAECGGFLYLHEELEDDEGRSWPMVGALSGKAVKGVRLGRFGYVTLTAASDGLLADKGESLRAHEYHYWQTERDDQGFCARKPQSHVEWACGVESKTLYAGFPHINLYGAPQAARRFVDACAAFGTDGGSAA
ncbi:MAG: cobyrinate a,c-diamide synthase [Atopobiaceae bacterium]|nr:cobyrinate a,c-diamide synthase [Atopobiaceae bacterium]